MKRICIIGPAIKMGGVERESVNLANALPSESYHVSFIAIFKSQHFFQLDPKIEFFEPKDFNIDRLSFYKSLFWLRKTIKKINPNAILVYNKFYGALVSLALISTDYDVFVSEASSPLYRWPFKQKILNKIAYKVRPPRGVKAQTNVSYPFLRRYYDKKTRIKVIPNPLRQVELYPEIKRKKWILAAGRFGDPLKGFDRLIEAYAKIKNTDWNLVFAGGDEDGQYLKDQAANLGVLDKIIFLGKVSDIDIVYAQAGIFVMPSRSEGFPNALCEAMGAGLPCISFDFISGPRDMITNGVNGILVKDGDIDGLAIAIDHLTSDVNLRNSLSIQALRIREWLEQKKISQNVADFILNLEEENWM